MVELIINGTGIDLPKDTSIKFTKQIADIFDIASVSVSHTNSFEFEKTPNNTIVMQQLGMSGDSSLIPYKLNIAVLKSYGFDVVSKGRFNIASTDENYKGSVISGMADFFKAIENKTIGIDLDLSNFNHEKDINSFLSSWTNEYYKYLVADYGGKNYLEAAINIDYQAPSFSVKKIWELIFQTFGFNCNYTNLDYINNLWISYPKDTADSGTETLIATLGKGNYVDNRLKVVGDLVTTFPDRLAWDTSVITEGTVVGGWNFIVPKTGSYKITLSVEMYMKWKFRFHKNRYRNFDNNVEITVNGNVVESLIVSGEETEGAERFLEIVIYLQSGDSVGLNVFTRLWNYISENGIPFEWHHNKTTFKIYKTNLGVVNLGSEFKDFSIKDFIKEILWRTGLTPVYNLETNTVDFYTLDSRLDFSNAIDMSDTFVNRESELYTNGYAQKNSFKLKADNESDVKKGDGYLYVNNSNISDEKTLVQSKLYSPDLGIENTFFGEDGLEYFKTSKYKIWDSETSINKSDEIEVKYKGLTGRYFFLRSKLEYGYYKFTSEKLNQSTSEDTLLFFYSADYKDTLFDTSIFKNYKGYQKILNNFRVHTIKQLLTLDDFNKIDMVNPVYFRQENAYYICNKVSFDEGKETTNEYIKINKL